MFKLSYHRYSNLSYQYRCLSLSSTLKQYVWNICIHVYVFRRTLYLANMLDLLNDVAWSITLVIMILHQLWTKICHDDMSVRNFCTPVFFTKTFDGIPRTKQHKAAIYQLLLIIILKYIYTYQFEYIFVIAWITCLATIWKFVHMTTQ